MLSHRSDGTRSRARRSPRRASRPLRSAPAVLLTLLSAALLHAPATLAPVIVAPDTTRHATVSRSESPPLPASARADSLVLEKGAHRLTVYGDGAVLRTYLVALGPDPVGDKHEAGDGRTPEGLYRIDARNPNSLYHLSLHISYPDSAHVAWARAHGVSPGGDIMIHGLPNGYESVGAEHRERDWTEGCVAVTDPEIEELWRLVPLGTPIRIEP